MDDEPVVTDADARKSRKVAQRKRWVAENPEKVRATKAAWRTKNRERINAKNRADRVANPEKRRVIEKRYIANNPEAARLSRQKWRATHPEAVRKAEKSGYIRNREVLLRRAKEYHIKNREKIRLYAAERRAKNLERKREYMRGWRANNKDSHRVSKSIRRARAKAAGGRFTVADIRAIAAAQKNRCAMCAVKITQATREIDHVIPIAMGGTSDRRNLQLLCFPCNRSKGATHPIDFAQSRGLLL